MPFRARFKYQKGSDTELRPYLELQLAGSYRVPGLLDTGADVSSLPYEAFQLVALAERDLDEVTGPWDEKTVYRPVRAIVAQLPGAPERTFGLRPLFDKRERHVRWGRDLLLHFAVSIDEREQQFTLFAD